MKEHESTRGCTIWIIGLSGAGKSTLARLLEERLRTDGYSAVFLEPSRGNEIKARLLPDLGFDKDSKNQITLRLGYVARLVTQAGGIAIVPWIAPEKWARDQVRGEIGRFVEVYVKCPLSVCEERDDRGLYARAREERVSVPGVVDPWEPPENPEVLVDSTEQTPEEEVAAVIQQLEKLGYVRSTVRKD